MVFCPHCHTLLSVGKSAATGGSLSRVITRITSGRRPAARHLAGLHPSQLKKNPLLQGLTTEQKRLVEAEVTAESERALAQTEAIWHCSACGHEQPLEPGTVLYQRDYQGEGEQDNLDYIVHDQATPRTRAYRCPNSECTTHRHPETREAILWHSEAGELTYICTLCEARWSPAF